MSSHWKYERYFNYRCRWKADRSTNYCVYCLSSLFLCLPKLTFFASMSLKNVIFSTYSSYYSVTTWARGMKFYMVVGQAEWNKPWKKKLDRLNGRKVIQKIQLKFNRTKKLQFTHIYIYMREKKENNNKKGDNNKKG